MAKSKKKYKLKKAKEEEPEDSTYSQFVGKYGQSERKTRTPEEKKEYAKLALFLIGWTILLATVYMVFVQIEDANYKRIIETGEEYKMSVMFIVVLFAYLIAGVSLFFVWLIFNGGFKKIDLANYERPDEMGYDEYCKIIEKLKERQRKAKYYLVLFLPFIMILLVDYVMMFWGDKLAG